MDGEKDDRMDALEGRMDAVAVEARLRAAVDQDLSGVAQRLDQVSRLIAAYGTVQSENLATLLAQQRRLDDHTAILRRHSELLGEHTVILAEHGESLARLESRLSGVESRLDGVESRLDGVESRLDTHEGKLDRIIGLLETRPS